MATLRDHITIAQLNRPVTVNKYVFAQDNAGGVIKILTSTYELYADVQQISNNYTLEQLQLKYGEGFRITVRYEPSRLLTPNDEITYNSLVHKIQAIRLQQEAAKRFVIITTSTGNSESNASDEPFVAPVNEYHWVAEGDEYTVQADEVIGWQGIIILFRDGVQFRVIREGTPSAKQVLYNQILGTFSFSSSVIPLEAGEEVDAYLAG